MTPDDLKLLMELQGSLSATTRLSAALGEFVYAISRARTKAPKLTAKCEEALDMSFAFAEFITKKVAEVRAASADGREGAK